MRVTPWIYVTVGGGVDMIIIEVILSLRVLACSDEHSVTKHARQR